MVKRYDAQIFAGRDFCTIYGQKEGLRHFGEALRAKRFIDRNKDLQGFEAPFLIATGITSKENSLDFIEDIRKYLKDHPDKELILTDTSTNSSLKPTFVFDTSLGDAKSALFLKYILLKHNPFYQSYVKMVSQFLKLPFLKEKILGYASTKYNIAHLMGFGLMDDLLQEGDEDRFDKMNIKCTVPLATDLLLFLPFKDGMRLEYRLDSGGHTVPTYLFFAYRTNNSIDSNFESYQKIEGIYTAQARSALLDRYLQDLKHSVVPNRMDVTFKPSVLKQGVIHARKLDTQDLYAGLANKKSKNTKGYVVPNLPLANLFG
jgi:hypothetical protein